MAKLQKYLFDVDFGSPNPRTSSAQDMEPELDAASEDAEEEVPPPPMFTEEELALVREQALEAGRQSGIGEAEAMTERLLAMALTSIGEQLRNLTAAQDMANETRSRDAVSVALAVVRKLQPEMSRDHAMDEIAGVVRECLTHIEKDVRVTIRVNPDHLEAIRQHAVQAAAITGFEGKLIYSADTRLAPGDCRVEWGDGGAERDQARLWTEIDGVVARALGLDASAEGTSGRRGDSDAGL